MQEKNYAIWSPIGGYKGLNREEMLKKTEEQHNELARCYDRWEKMLDSYATRINGMLREKKKASEIVKVVLEEGFQTCCNVEYLFSCFSVACQIGSIEEDNGYPSNLALCDTMEEVCDRMQELVFGLRRIEFDWEEESLISFFDRIREWEVSYVFLGEIMCQRTIYDQMGTADKLARFWEKQGKHKEVILLLFYVANRLEYRMDVVLTFANTLLEAGDIYWGSEMLNKMQNPPPEVQKWQSMLAERLGR